VNNTQGSTKVDLTQPIFDKAKANHQRIIYSEGTDIGIIKAAAQGPGYFRLQGEKILVPIWRSSQTRKKPLQKVHLRL
jgi:phosphotransacetylase